MNADDFIDVKLTAAQWNAVMNMLGDQPFKVSAQLIEAIRVQCLQHDRGHQSHQNQQLRVAE